MQTFATVDDYIARWGEVDEGKAEILLEDASAQLLKLMRDSEVEIDLEDEVQAVNLKSVTCAMVSRALLPASSMNGVPLQGVTQFTNTAGPYTGSYTFSNATGDLYPTKKEMQKLGIGRQRINVIRPAIHGGDGNELPDW